MSIKLRKRTPEEQLNYLIMQFSIMRVELNNIYKDLDKIERKLGLKEKPKAFKKKPSKGQKCLYS